MRPVERLALVLAEMCPSWLKEHDWKSCKRVSASRVRIPTSPPFSILIQGFHSFYTTYHQSSINPAFPMFHTPYKFYKGGSHEHQ